MEPYNYYSGIFSHEQIDALLKVQYAEARQAIDAYLKANRAPTGGFTMETRNFANWIFNYFTKHSDTTFEQFKNWFLAPNEGKDFFYDEAFWENPALSFPQQDLPSWNGFESAYPTQSGAVLVGVIGGPVQQAYNDYPSLSRGYCALKVSRALNYSGISIPQITTTSGNPGTILGGDGKYYFLNAKALNKWMRETFGTSPSNPDHYSFLGSDGGVNGENFPTLVAGLKGIYSMVSTNANWASGHADILRENGTCKAGCHFQDTPPAPIDYIDIWVLK
jgi:hypothetical protein